MEEAKLDINFNLSVDQCLLRLLGLNSQSLSSIAASLESLARDARLAREKYDPVSSDVEGISVTQKESPMAKKKWVIIKKTAGMKMRAGTKAALPSVPGTGAIIDGGQGTFTVTGLDSETPPVPVDISALATLTVTSADPDVVVGTITGMTTTLTAPTAGASGTATVTFVATANDGSFTDTTTCAVTYSGGAITGIQVIQTA